MNEIQTVPKGHIFVFGSNLSGRHGKGAALVAKNHYGAIYGQGFGLQGMSYAIPTKDRSIKTLPLYTIANYVNLFLLEAEKDYSDKGFFVTQIGCGHAGYTPEQIAPFFEYRPRNVILNDVFLMTLNK